MKCKICKKEINKSMYCKKCLETITIRRCLISIKKQLEIIERINKSD